MKQIFLAAPFKSLIDKKTMTMFGKDKHLIVSLITLLEEKGYHVHNAHKREQWGSAFMSPDECTEIDFREIEKCDIFIALPGNPPSPGTHIELGWASAFHKEIILLLHRDMDDYAYLVRGLHVVTDVTYLVYHNDEECCRLLTSCV